MTAGSGFDPTGYIVGGMTFADYDGTGRQSIYLSYWTEELAGDPARTVVKGAFPGQNRLYRNLGDYRFEDVTYAIGIGEYHADSFTAIFADFTGDGLPDIYQANDHRPDRFYQNMGGGRFKDAGDRRRPHPCRQQHGRGDDGRPRRRAPALRDQHHRSERPATEATWATPSW